MRTYRFQSCALLFVLLLAHLAGRSHSQYALRLDCGSIPWAVSYRISLLQFEAGKHFAGTLVLQLHMETAPLQDYYKRLRISQCGFHIPASQPCSMSWLFHQQNRSLNFKQVSALPYPRIGFQDRVRLSFRISFRLSLGTTAEEQKTHVRKRNLVLLPARAFNYIILFIKGSIKTYQDHLRE